MRFLVEFSRGTPRTSQAAEAQKIFDLFDRSIAVGGIQAPPELIAALQAAHARDHQLVQQLQQAQQALAEGRAALEAQNNMLRERTIERDHYAQDSHLWSCCLAYIVERDGDSDGELTLPTDAVNKQEGRMLSARVDDDGFYTTITVGPRPEASEEGHGG